MKESSKREWEKQRDKEEPMNKGGEGEQRKVKEKQREKTESKTGR